MTFFTNVVLKNEHDAFKGSRNLLSCSLLVEPIACHCTAILIPAQLWRESSIARSLLHDEKIKGRSKFDCLQPELIPLNARR